MDRAYVEKAAAAGAGKISLLERDPLRYLVRSVGGGMGLTLIVYVFWVLKHNLNGMPFGNEIAAAFFGVRGVGSLYYLAYAAGHAYFPEERWLWSTVAFAIVISVVVHGVLATPVMNYLERRRSLA